MEYLIGFIGFAVGFLAGALTVAYQRHRLEQGLRKAIGLED